MPWGMGPLRAAGFVGWDSRPGSGGPQSHRGLVPGWRPCWGPEGRGLSWRDHRSQGWAGHLWPHYSFLKTRTLTLNLQIAFAYFLLLISWKIGRGGEGEGERSSSAPG